jgi:two-component system CheB/CheR fusion protein
MGTAQRPYSSTNVVPRCATGHPQTHDNCPEFAAVEPRIVFVVDNDAQHRDELRDALEDLGFEVETFSICATFLATHQSGRRGCLLVNASTPGIGVIELIKKARSNGCGLAVIAMATRFTTARVVEAMKAGASDCLDMPAAGHLLTCSLDKAFEEADSMVDALALRSLAMQRVATLTARQREILDLITIGQPSKNIAADLQISQRTVENHRAAIARKTCSRSLSEVVHTAVCADCSLMKAARN